MSGSELHHVGGRGEPRRLANRHRCNSRRSSHPTGRTESGTRRPVGAASMISTASTWACAGPVRIAASKAATVARDSGMRSVEVRVNGPGSGRESAIRAIQASGIDVKLIRDVTPIPHNGCRPPKRRRV